MSDDETQAYDPDETVGNAEMPTEGAIDQAELDSVTTLEP